MVEYKIQRFPDARIASIDICEISGRKHHVAGFVEFDVTCSREKIRRYNREKKGKISFTAWLIYVVGRTIKNHEQSSAFLKGKNKLFIFEDVNVSIIVEKNLNGVKVPIPLIVEKANERSIESITTQILDAKTEEFTKNGIVLQHKTQKIEKVYYLLPGFLRRFFWRFLLDHPKLAFQKMGNVAFTSLGAVERINGWFIPKTVHPICFAAGSIIKKPIVIDNKVEIREILNMSILIDHDVMDGAPMARFIGDLSKNIEFGLGL